MAADGKGLERGLSSATCSFLPFDGRASFTVRGFPPSLTRGRRRSCRGGNAESGQGGSMRSRGYEDWASLFRARQRTDEESENAAESERNVNETDVAIFHRQRGRNAAAFSWSFTPAIWCER
ncbi:hypothetical protein HPB47_026183 [Ixodes persulcatus]|uniref:Uncharacterized protein n=1 Tax=Ixodes persulcatus TaxID=34615 RepID=A0AC60PZG9_IXOPE|nr:hypothetical protein HPB47_026183 [Ixodes persulcatus]